MKSPINDFPTYPKGGILAFYSSQHPDSAGRTIDEIWLWSYEKLEYTHNYIQWLFPLREASRFNTSAPTLNDEIIQAFLSNEELRNRLVKSLKLMLKFYGLQCNDTESSDIQISKSEEYPQRKREWIDRLNHNYLRLTRILTSLRILGLNSYAQALFHCLDSIYQEEQKSIGSETYAYWRDAILIK